MIDMRKVHLEMQEIRRTGRTVSLNQHLAGQYPAIGNTDRLYSELEIDPSITRVNALLDRDDNANYLFPEVITELIEKGVVAKPMHQDVIMGSETVPQPAMTMPHLKLADAKPSRTTPGATIQKGTVSWGKKTVEIATFARGIELPYEAIQFCTINMIAPFLRSLGRKLGAMISRMAVETLINGDQADGSEAAAVVGVSDVSKLVQYRDFVRVWTRMNMMGLTPRVIVTTENLTNHTLEIDEFKKRESGTTEGRLSLQDELPKDQKLRAQVAVPSGAVIEVDPSSAMVQLTAQQLMVETDKIINRRMQETAASIITGFAIVERAARIVIDTTRAWEDNQFPAWFAPEE